DPLAQLAASYVDLAAIEHRRERLLEQIRSVQWQVRPLHLGELLLLRLLEVPGVFLQREACLLQRGCRLRPLQLSHLLPADLVESVVCEPLHVEAVVDVPCLRSPLLHRRDVRRRQDRKSTRLNSSHVKISYAVFCSKKK